MSKIVLAYRIYPKPEGTSYFADDLKNQKIVLELFDYCQILEAVIYKEGWEFLIKQFGVEKLFELNQNSGWLDVENSEDFKKELERQMNVDQ